MLGNFVSGSNSASVTLLQVGRSPRRIEMMNCHTPFLCVHTRSEHGGGAEQNTHRSGIHGGDHRLTCLFRLALLYEAYFRSRYAVRFRLKGNSMFPLLRNGKDVVVLGKCPAESLQPMDVVLFRYRGKHVLHRIIRREGERLLIQGDGSIVAKEECTVDDVIGKVVQICRPSGKEIPVGSWQWTIPSRVWRGLGFLRIWLLRVAYRLFLRPVK